METRTRSGLLRLAWPTLVAVLLLGALLALALWGNLKTDLRLAQQRADQQMRLITDIVTSQLQGDHYQEIEPLLGRIAEADDSIAAIQLSSVNGFTIAGYRKPRAHAHLVALDTPIAYSYHRAAVLHLEVDQQVVYDVDRRFALQLSGIYAAVCLLLCLLNHIAIKRAREAAQLRITDARLRHTNRTLKVLSDCNQALVRSTSEQELMDDLCRVLVEEGGYLLAWIGLAGPDGTGELLPVAASGRIAYLDALDLSPGAGTGRAGPTESAIRTGEPTITRDTLTDARMAPWRAAASRFGFRSSIALPLGSTVPATGALNIYAGTPSRFDEDEVRLLEELASDLSYGLQSRRTEALRHAAERRIEEQGRRFRALVEGSGDGVVVVRADGTISYAGPSTTRIMGFLPRDLEGHSTFEFIHPDDAPDLQRTLQASLDAPGHPIEARARVRHLDGHWLAMEGTFSNLLGDAAVGGVVINFRDITRRLALEQAQLESNERFQQIADNVSEAFWVSGTSGYELMYVSPAYEKIWQRKVADLAHDPLQWIDAVHPDDIVRVRRAVAEKQIRGQYDEEYRIVRPDGTTRWIRDRAFPVRDSRGEIYRIVGIAEDITQSKTAALQIQYLNRIYALLSGINTLIVRARDRNDLFREACRLAIEVGQFRMAWIGMIDRKAQRVQPVAWSGDVRDVLETVPLSLVDGTADFGLVGQSLAAGAMIVSNDVRNDPRLRLREVLQAQGLESLAVMPLVVAGQAVGVFSLYSTDPGFFDKAEERLLRELTGDISFALEHIEKSEKIDHLAYYDQLTGLPNGTLFHERVAQGLDAAVAARAGLGIVLVDIDRFRAVNDSLGRLAGDDLIRQMAARLAQFVDEHASLARTGSNQFSILLPGLDSAAALADFVVALFKACLDQPYRLEGARELRIALKAGIALAPQDGTQAEILQRNAEAALKKAKSSGERFLFYAPQMNEKAAERLSFESRLQAALQRDEFVLHYQPKIDLRTGAVSGVEALIRWQSPELGLVQPLRFIPLLEETGLILEVGAWVLQRAALDRRQWLAHGIDAPRIAVNVSPVQLRRWDFNDTLRAALAPDPQSSGIDIELTESLLMEDIDENVKKLVAAREMGVRVAIDDFGTGYSSLRYLAKLPVHTLKIDRTFVITMLGDANEMTLVSTIISMAHSLGLEVVAEGVDEQAQADALRDLGCDQIQGFLISRPVPNAALLAFLQADGAAARAAATAAAPARTAAARKLRA